MLMEYLNTKIKMALCPEKTYLLGKVGFSKVVAYGLLWSSEKWRIWNGLKSTSVEMGVAYCSWFNIGIKHHSYVIFPSLKSWAYFSPLSWRSFKTYIYSRCLFHSKLKIWCSMCHSSLINFCVTWKLFYGFETVAMFEITKPATARIKRSYFCRI